MFHELFSLLVLDYLCQRSSIRSMLGATRGASWISTSFLWSDHITRRQRGQGQTVVQTWGRNAEISIEFVRNIFIIVILLGISSIKSPYLGSENRHFFYTGFLGSWKCSKHTEIGANDFIEN